MKIKNSHAVGWRPVLASVNGKIRGCISLVVVGSETGHGPCRVELCQGKHLHVVLHQRLLEKEAEPSRKQLYSQIHSPGARISIGKKYSVAETSSMVLSLRFKTLPYELLGRCGGIKAGGLDARSHKGKLGNESWIVQHTEVVPIYGKVIVLASSAFRSLNE